MDDFETVKANAWSLEPSEEPYGMALIFVKETEYGTFKYYKDATTGEYRYQSQRTEEFHKWIKGKEKERKECLKKSRNELKRDSA